jgi:hypothetical protein
MGALLLAAEPTAARFAVLAVRSEAAAPSFALEHVAAAVRA